MSAMKLVRPIRRRKSDSAKFLRIRMPCSAFYLFLALLPVVASFVCGRRECDQCIDASREIAHWDEYVRNAFRWRNLGSRMIATSLVATTLETTRPSGRSAHSPIEPRCHSIPMSCQRYFRFSRLVEQSTIGGSQWEDPTPPPDAKRGSVVFCAWRRFPLALQQITMLFSPVARHARVWTPFATKTHPWNVRWTDRRLTPRHRETARTSTATTNCRAASS